MLLEWGVGMADRHQNEEEKERPHQLYQELDLRWVEQARGVAHRWEAPGPPRPGPPS